MADQSDIETSLVALISGALYPQGTGEPSIPGQPCRIYRGWPNAPALDADLAAGLVTVTVSSIDGTARNTTRYPDTWLSDPPLPTLLVSAAANTVTFGGSADVGQLAGIAADGKTYVYRTQPNDTPALVAANLAAQARADHFVLLSGSTITLEGVADLFARVAADGSAQLEIRRQMQRFRTTIWCSDPSVRDTVATLVDLALASLRFITLADNTQARLLFAGGSTIDRSENASLYRRDLLYDIEYPTTIVAAQPTMLFGAGTVNSTPIIG